MNLVRLPGPDARTTPQLGFGCAYLVPESARLLEVAYESGIRHFDVGRSYGRGLTESVLGRFARRHADLTLTSKYGIRPPFTHPLHGVARRFLRPAVRLLRRAPAIDRSLDGAVGISNQKADFSAGEAARSLELSLRNLRAERLDLFLMHEADTADLQDARLLDQLREAVRRGRIGAFGVGGEARRVPALLASSRAFCDVLQHEWSPLAPLETPATTFSVLYRVFGQAAAAVRALDAREPGMLARCSEVAGCGVEPPGLLERLFLSATLQLRPQALVLFSSTRAEHIIDNVRAAGDAACGAAGRRVIDLVCARQPARGRGMAERSFRARVALGISGQAFARVMFAVSTLVLVPLLVSAWGLEGYGQWIALTALTSYLGLSNFGLVTTAANDVVIAIGARDEARARRSFQNSVCLAVYVVLPLIALVLAAAWTAPLGRWLHLTQISVAAVRGILICSGVTLWFQTLRGLLVAALYATGTYGLAYALQGCAKLLEIVGLSLLVLVFAGGQWAAAGWITAVAFVELAVVAWLAYRAAPWARLDLTAFDRRWLRGQLKPALGFMISNFATQGLLLQGPRVVLGVLLGGTAVAVYAIYGTAMRFVDQLLLSLVLPLEVEFAHSTGKGDYRNVDRLIVLGTHVSWLLFAFVCAGLLLFGPVVFKVWTAGRAEFSYALMALFMLLSGCNLIGRVGLHALISTNRLFGPSCWILAVAAIGLALGGALTRPLGVEGMLLGNAAGELVNSLIVIWVVTRWLGKSRTQALHDLVRIGPSIRLLRAQSRHAWYRLRPGT